MKPYTTIKKNDTVIVWQKVFTELSTVTKEHVGKMFTVSSCGYEGRRHNQYIAYVYLVDKGGFKVRACVEELARCNPNFEPEGEFITCVGCGAAISTSDLKVIKHLNGAKACPSCGVIDPTSS